MLENLEPKPQRELVIRREHVKILAVSDTHLGFDEANPRFLEFIKEITTSFDVDYFFILGDFLDLWRRDLAGVIVQFSDVVAELKKINEKIKVILIAGNHDWHLIPGKYTKGDVYSYPEPYQWYEVVKVILPEREYKFLHGHQFDPKCSNEGVNESLCHSNDNAGKAMSEAWYKAHLTGAAMEEAKFHLLNNPNYPRIPPWALSTIEYVANPGAAGRRWQEIKDRVESTENSYEYTVYGHTHHAYVSSKSANTGCWCKDKSDYILIDNYEVTLHEW